MLYKTPIVLDILKIIYLNYININILPVICALS